MSRQEFAAGGRLEGRLLLILFPLLKLLIHLFTFGGYGWFRDEFYYVACSENLAFGYVDHPPLSVVILWTARTLLGDSLFAVRLLPALAGAATVLLTGLIAREMGGRRFAQALAMVAAIAAPNYLGTDHVFSMNAFDILIWTLSGYLLVRLLEEPTPRLWLLLGLSLGLGLQNKISVLWLGFGLFVGLLAMPCRRLLLTKWPWIAGAVAFAIFLPHLVWQAATGWPTLEFIQNATSQKMAPVSPLEFLSDQILIMSPLSLPIWLLGLGWLLGTTRGRRFGVLGGAYVVVFLLLIFSGTSRAGYLAPAYTWLFAAGGLALERMIARVGWPGLKAAVIGLPLLGGLIAAPLALPVLPVRTYIDYAAAIGVRPSTEERKEVAELPQHYADMHGWESIVGTVAEVYQGLPLEEQQAAAFFTSNYGVAGAIDLLGRERDLPPAVSGHNNYWLWGTRGISGRVMIFIGGSEERLGELFETVERAATIDCGLCMPYENGRPVWVARGPRISLEELWPRLKHYD
jgi:hypothetical protein